MRRAPPVKASHFHFNASTPPRATSRSAADTTSRSASAAGWQGRPPEVSGAETPPDTSARAVAHGSLHGAVKRSAADIGRLSRSPTPSGRAARARIASPGATPNLARAAGSAPVSPARQQPAAHSPSAVSAKTMRPPGSTSVSPARQQPPARSRAAKPARAGVGAAASPAGQQPTSRGSLARVQDGLRASGREVGGSARSLVSEHAAVRECEYASDTSGPLGSGRSPSRTSHLSAEVNNSSFVVCNMRKLFKPLGGMGAVSSVTPCQKQKICIRKPVIFSI